jgi:urea transport system substrate-binding protein
VPVHKNHLLIEPGQETLRPCPAMPETAATGRDTETGSRQPGTTKGASAHTWIGKSLGRYEVTGSLGEGGMGVVLKAHDPMIDRPVAIKLLADHLAADETSLARFLAEARAIGRINHPNVCAIYEVCQDGSTTFLVMEYLPGGSLEDQLDKEGPCSVLKATQALIDACKGMSAAHAAGLFHRDIKPANFLCAADGSIKVSDFGLAKAAGRSSRQLTQEGIAVGTPSFMSPEQCGAGTVDARSDIYALGATYYTLLTGKAPYAEADNIVRLMYLHCEGPILDPRAVNPAIPQACAHIIARAMAKAPADRYQSVPEMLADLQAVAATLSGQIEIALPSGMGTRPSTAKKQGPPAWKRTLSIAAAAGLGLFVLLGLPHLVGWPGQKLAGSTPAAPVPTGEPIKVGVLHSLSGTMAASGSAVVDATMFAIDEINEAGGVLGRPVKPVVADGRSDWPLFAREAERLIVDEKVCTIFGCWTSSGRKMVKPVVEKYDHLLIYPVQYEGLETSPCIVYLGAAPNQQIIPAIDWAVRVLNKRRFLLVGSDYVFPRTANEIVKDYVKGIGVEIVGEKYLPLGSQNCQPVLEAIAQTKPDMILNTINGDSNVAFFRTLRTAGIKPADLPTLSFSVGEQELRSLDPADVEGDYAASTYFQTLATPENADFVRGFHEVYPQRSVTDPMETAYVGVKLWASAVHEAQSLDPKKIRRAILNQRILGPGGEVRIDPDTQHAFKTPRLGRIRHDGQFEIVWSAPQPVAPLPYPGTRTSAAWTAFLSDLHAGWGNRWAAPD